MTSPVVPAEFAPLHLWMYRRTSARVRLVVSETNPATGAAAATDLTGATAYWTAKVKLDDADADAIWQKTVGSGITVVDAEGGVLELATVPADTDVLVEDESVRLVWDLKITLADGREIIPAAGTMTVLPAVTRT